MLEQQIRQAIVRLMQRGERPVRVWLDDVEWAIMRKARPRYTIPFTKRNTVARSRVVAASGQVEYI